jgi:peptidoglycan-associated lipoprotein
MRPATSLLALTVAVLATLLGGCASPGTVDGRTTEPVVVRTSNSTTWVTDESLAAAAAEAARKAAAARPALAAVPLSRVAPVEAGPAVAAPEAGAAPAAAALPPRLAETERIVYFAFDRYEIQSEFQLMLDRRARALLAAPQQRLVVEGHADERGGREYNLALGQKRAEAVIRALALLGVLESQLEAVSFGDTQPAAEGQNEQAWSQNRRAELKDR